jgi:hypothetical protein
MEGRKHEFSALTVWQHHSSSSLEKIKIGELLLFGHGIKVGFFAHHSQVDTTTFQEKCKNLE